MVLIDKLTAIGDAIRAKDGSTELLTLDQMPTAIAAIPTGGGGDLPEEAFTIKGAVKYKFALNNWNWFIEKYGDQIITKTIYNLNSMFAGSDELLEIPFEFNLSAHYVNGHNIDCTYAFSRCGTNKIIINIPKTSTLGEMPNMFADCVNLTEINDLACNHESYHGMEYMFENCQKLTQLPYLYNAYPDDLSYFFYGCSSLKAIPEDYFDTWNFNRINTYKNAGVNNMFTSCYSLRNIPTNIFSYFCNETVAKSSYNNFYCKSFSQCFALDEVIDVPVVSVALTSNVFTETFLGCGRVKNITFKTNEDGTAKTVNWKNQIVDLATDTVGFIASSNVKVLLTYSDITEDKKVTDDTTYQALKDDDDWFTNLGAYSRYNHDSAVNTINSLPDASAYGGTNTIKFIGNAGSSTDGGAINTLTEEEIAVAATKGWTVALK